MTFYNHIKACFSNKKYTVEIKTYIVNSIYFMEKLSLIEFVKVIVFNYLLIRFSKALACNKI